MWQFCKFIAHNYHKKGDFKSPRDDKQWRTAMEEAKTWFDKFKDKGEMDVKFSNLSNKPSLFQKIKTNRVRVKLQKSDYSECSCQNNDIAPCTVENGCYNVILQYECDPILCNAKVIVLHIIFFLIKIID